MERLREMKTGDPFSSELARLVRATDPIAPSALRKARVRARLHTAKRSRTVAWFKPATAIGLLLCSAAASAMWGPKVVQTIRTLVAQLEQVNRRSSAKAVAAPPSAPTTPVAQAAAPAAIVSNAPPASNRAPVRRKPETVSKAEAEAGTETETVAVAGTEPVAVAVAVAETAPEAAKPQPLDEKLLRQAEAARKAESVQDNVSLVLEATRALRRDHDAARAFELCDEYLRHAPAGALAEEALALSIEATAGEHDPRARSLAARYLMLYPDGRFRDVAERTKKDFSN